MGIGGELFGVEGGDLLVDDGGFFLLSTRGEIVGNLHILEVGLPHGPLLDIDVAQHVVGVDVLGVEGEELLVLLDGLVPATFLEIDVGHLDDIFLVSPGRGRWRGHVPSVWAEFAQSYLL